MVGEDKNNRKRNKHGFAAEAILLFIGKNYKYFNMASLSHLETLYPCFNIRYT